MHSSQTFVGLARLGWRRILLHKTTHPRECILLFLACLMNWVSQEACQKKAPRSTDDQTWCLSWFSAAPGVQLPTEQTCLPLSCGEL